MNLLPRPDFAELVHQRTAALADEPAELIALRAGDVLPDGDTVDLIDERALPLAPRARRFSSFPQ